MKTSSERSMDYGFKDGNLRFVPSRFGADGVMVSGGVQEIPIVDGPTPEQREALKWELNGGTVKLAESPDGDGTVETVTLNHEAPEANGLAIFGMGIGGNFRHPVGTRDVATLAAANPDQRILVMNNAGSEASSLVPREVIQEMLRTGSYMRKGDWLLHVLQREFEAYGENVALWGNSAGGRVAMGLAAAFGERGATVNNVRVVDPPSVRKRSPLGVMWGFASQAGDQGKYRASPYGVLEESDEKTANLFTARGAFTDNMLRYPAVMGKTAGFEDDLEAAMAAARGDLTFISPEHSQFATPDEVRAAMARAALHRLGQAYHIVALDHSHTIMSDSAGSRPMVTLHEAAKRTAAGEYD